MKCMQDCLRSGALDEVVRCRTSLVEMFPTTLWPLSTTAILVSPSSNISINASDRGASELVEGVDNVSLTTDVVVP